MAQNISCIYKIASKATGRFYIGSAKIFNLRKAGHLCDLRNNKHHSIFLQRNYNKYGQEDLVFEIVEEVPDINNLIGREQYYIDLLKPHFNIAPKAGSTLGIKKPEHVKQKLRELNTGEKNRFYGRQHSEETKEVIRKKKIGQSAGERNYFFGKRFTGDKNYMFGRTHTEDAKAKIREARSRQVFSEDTRRKMSESRTGAKAYNARKVICIETGKVYGATAEAARDLDLFSQDIGKVCRGKLKTTGGYRFKYADLLPLPHATP